MQQELVKYIRKEQLKGFNNATIKSALMNEGYEEADVEKAFRILFFLKFCFYLMIGAAVVSVSIIISKGSQTAIGAEILSKIGNLDKYSEGEIYSKADARNANYAISRKDKSLCGESGNLEQYCEILIDQDINLCRKIEGKLGESCVMEIAIRQGNDRLCNEAGSLKEDCLLHFAIIRQDLSLCSKLDKNRDFCLMYVGRMQS